MRLTAFVGHSDCARHDTGWRHPDHQGRLPALFGAVHRDMLVLHDRLLEMEGRHASDADLLRVHSAAYLATVRTAVTEAERSGSTVALSPDVVVGGATWPAATASAGLALSAIDAVRDGRAVNAFCACRPPGAGASPGSAGRFALFNNAAVAVRYLLDSGAADRVALLHFGGAAALGAEVALGGELGVRLASIHEPSSTPLPPAPANAQRFALHAGAGLAEYGAALADALASLEADGPPNWVVLGCGFDALAADPYGGLALEPLDLHALTVAVVAAAERWCGGRLVSLLEGGYAAREAGRAAVQHVRALAGLPPQ